MKLWSCFDVPELSLSCGGSKWEETDIQNIHLPTLVSRFPCSKDEERLGKGGVKGGGGETMRERLNIRDTYTLEGTFMDTELEGSSARYLLLSVLSLPCLKWVSSNRFIILHFLCSI